MAEERLPDESPDFWDDDDNRIAALRAALVKAQAEVKAAEKDKTNEHSKFDYASREGIASTAKEVMARNGLAFSLRGPTAVDSNAAVFRAVLTHERGGQEEWDVIWAVHWEMKGMTREQRLGAAMSYAMKNELLALFNIPREMPGQEIDSHAQGEERAPRRDAPARRERTPEEAEHLALFKVLTEESIRSEVVRAAKDIGISGKTLKDCTVEELREIEARVFGENRGESS